MNGGGPHHCTHFLSTFELTRQSSGFVEGDMKVERRGGNRVNRGLGCQVGVRVAYTRSIVQKLFLCADLLKRTDLRTIYECESSNPFCGVPVDGQYGPWDSSEPIIEVKCIASDRQ